MSAPKNGRSSRPPKPVAPKLRPFKARVQWVLLDDEDVEHVTEVQEVSYKGWDEYVASLPAALAAASLPPDASA